MTQKVSKVTVSYTDGSEEIILLHNVHSIKVEDTNTTFNDLPSLLGSPIYENRILTRTTYRSKNPSNGS